MLKKSELIANILSIFHEIETEFNIDKGSICRLFGVKLYKSKLNEFGINKLEKIHKEIEFYYKLLYSLNNHKLVTKIDYIRCRIPIGSQDIIVKKCKDILEKLFLVSFECYSELNKSFYGYRGMYEFENIRLMFPPGERIEELGLLLELSGSGVNQVYEIYKNMGYDIDVFLQNLLDLGGIFTRVDICLDDKLRLFSLKELMQDFENGLLIPKTKNNRPIYQWIKEDEQIVKSEPTLYFGSMQSDLYWCFYDKEQESKKERYIYEYLGKFPEWGNRYELRLKNEKSIDFVKAYLELFDNGLGLFIGSYLENYFIYKRDNGDEDIRFRLFLDCLKKTNFSEYEYNFYEYEKKLLWLKNSVRNSLVIIRYVDKILGTTYFEDIFLDKTISKKSVNILARKSGKTYFEIKKMLIQDGCTITN